MTRVVDHDELRLPLGRHGVEGRQQRPDAGLQHSRGQGANPGSTQGPKPSGSRLYAVKYRAISLFWGGLPDFKGGGGPGPMRDRGR